MPARYVNAFKCPHSPEPAVYETNARPRQYRGVFLIYRRLPECFDLVLDGVCIGQRAGHRGCTDLADLVLDDPGDYWAQRALQLMRSVVDG